MPPFGFLGSRGRQKIVHEHFPFFVVTTFCPDKEKWLPSGVVKYLFQLSYGVNSDIKEKD